MTSTSQMRGVSILHHGVMVWNAVQDILDGTITKLPDWMDVSLLKNSIDINITRDYAILHDCGKPFCRTVDENGKQHFPDHAKHSGDVYSEYFNNSDVELLIRNDMFLHTCKSVDIDQLDVNRVDLLKIQLLVSFAEIHANCTMFGGIESTSFKIKYKQLDKRGKQLWSKLFV